MHSIEKCEDPCTERYSFTFWHIFLDVSSTLLQLLETLLHFGDGKETLGNGCKGNVWKLFTSTIYIYIPDPTKIGPYHNIVLHTVSTDINNIKNRNSRSNQELGNIMDDESKSIRYY